MKDIEQILTEMPNHSYEFDLLQIAKTLKIADDSELMENNSAVVCKIDESKEIMYENLSKRGQYETESFSSSNLNNELGARAWEQWLSAKK